MSAATLRARARLRARPIHRRTAGSCGAHEIEYVLSRTGRSRRSASTMLAARATQPPVKPPRRSTTSPKMGGHTVTPSEEIARPSPTAVPAARRAAGGTHAAGDTAEALHHQPEDGRAHRDAQRGDREAEPDRGARGTWAGQLGHQCVLHAVPADAEDADADGERDEQPGAGGRRGGREQERASERSE